MRFLVDAQLPPALARLLSRHGHLAEHVHDIGLGAAADRDIWSHARDHDAVLITKDETSPTSSRPIHTARMARQTAVTPGPVRPGAASDIRTHKPDLHARSHDSGQSDEQPNRAARHVREACSLELVVAHYVSLAPCGTTKSHRCGCLPWRSSSHGCQRASASWLMTITRRCATEPT